MQYTDQFSFGNARGLKCLFDFVSVNKWYVLSWGGVGLLLSFGYVHFSPYMYEARCQIQMARYINNSAGSGINYVNSEESAVLMQRLRFASSYPDEVIQTCGLSKNAIASDYLGGALVAQAVGGISNVVELWIRGNSPDVAKSCAVAVVSMITKQQRDLIREVLAGRDEQLKEYDDALRREMAEVEMQRKARDRDYTMVKSGRLAWLMARVDMLHEEALLSQRHPTKLLAPVSVSRTPVSPAISRILVLGVSLGLVIGVLHAWLRREWLVPE